MGLIKQYLDQFFSMGIYAYFVIIFFVVALVYSIMFQRFQKNSKAKWIAEHPGSVIVHMKTGVNFITEKQLRATVVSGEASVFLEKGKHVVYSMPGKTVLELTYTYTRPGLMYKNVSTTWGPAKVSLNLEANKEYNLSFDKEKEEFVLEEI